MQAMNCDEKHAVNVYAVKLDGVILPVKERPLKLEFIGDSITSGEGSRMHPGYYAHVKAAEAIVEGIRESFMRIHKNL